MHRVRNSDISMIDPGEYNQCAEDYIMTAKYDADILKKRIIRSLDELKISPENSLGSWLDFVVKVFQGLLKPDLIFQTYFKNTFQSFLENRSVFVQYNSKGFKALIPKGGNLAADVFIVYHAGANGERQHACSWVMAEGDSEVEQRRWELHSSVPNDGANTATEDTPSTPA
ncbi:MAG: hypothetical protein Q9221_003842 [Calogaya cf. arnoldii]